MEAGVGSEIIECLGIGCLGTGLRELLIGEERKKIETKVLTEKVGEFFYYLNFDKKRDE